MTVIATAVEMLRQDLGIANRRIDELQGALADARTAAMISSNDAAALRAQLVELLSGLARRPRRSLRWRRWFR